ncbi:hypothetical protein F5B22DRAFT_86800 [Xylaria bambusicola]|uniref:uncharacterized protein n=1 Tax=Xylaria bambusicola TaxID=326684 RepID=UPI00200724D2|nr:uncharacterized protein F5B22DRAFT_86800 [Xylaria bambusicola]KAI0517977.1 hypothetical protein F5B22DRAFT_86800 [Xylaria bambusicola]
MMSFVSSCFKVTITWLPRLCNMVGPCLPNKVTTSYGCNIAVRYPPRLSTFQCSLWMSNGRDQRNCAYVNTKPPFYRSVEVVRDNADGNMLSIVVYRLRLVSGEEALEPLNQGVRYNWDNVQGSSALWVCASRAYTCPFSIQCTGFLTFHRPSPEILTKAARESKQGLEACLAGTGHKVTAALLNCHETLFNPMVGLFLERSCHLSSCNPTFGCVPRAMGPHIVKDTGRNHSTFSGCAMRIYLDLEHSPTCSRLSRVPVVAFSASDGFKSLNY